MLNVFDRAVLDENRLTIWQGREALDNFSINAAPEPSSWILSGTAALIGGLVLVRRRRQARPASSLAVA